MEIDSSERQRRKEEGKRKKRQRIEEAGGVRPREKASSGGMPDKKVGQKNDHNDTSKSSSFKNYDRNRNFRPHNNDGGGKSTFSKHRFGRVMERVPCRNKPRFSTVSIALPGSVLSNCQTRELRTLLVGQIARAATIYHVDEIIVFDDKLGKNSNNYNSNNGGWRDFKRRRQDNDAEKGQDNASTEKKNSEADHEKEGYTEYRPRSTHQEFMARLLQYCECPQYLRRVFFPMHPDLQFAGLLAPIDAPHHVRVEDRCKYREGVVMKKNSPSGNSFVNCGIRNRPVE